MSTSAQAPVVSSVRAHKLKDVRFDNFWTEVDQSWKYDDFISGHHPDYTEGWISFDCLLTDDKRGVIWCGLSSFAGDIFYAFNRGNSTFHDMGFQKVGDRYDAKFHRALMFDRDGCLWAATAMLHDPQHYFDAPGGAIVKVNADTGKIIIVDRPLPHMYIQSLILDVGRNIFYGQTYVPEFLIRYDPDGGEVRVLAHLGHIAPPGGDNIQQCEQLSIDRNGTVWGCYSPNRAWAQTRGPCPQRLLRYHPDEDIVHFLEVGIPHANGTPGTAKVDGTATGPDGAVYMGTREGLLCRIDPDSGRVDTIGQPGRQASQRLAAMESWSDGRLYGVCGKGGIAEVFSYEPAADRLINHGPIYDPALRVGAYQVHDITITSDGVIFAGENDVPHRSSYLWEINGICGVGL